MKIAIIGTGGVGGYFGGKLATSGNNVTFISRGEHLKAMQTNGLKVKSIQGDFLVHPVNASDDLRQVKNCDLIILCVKAWQVKEVMNKIKVSLKPDTTILPLQNGILASEEAATIGGREKVLGGLCRIISKIESPGVIHHMGVEPVIIFGELDNHHSDRVLLLKDTFEKAEIKSHLADDIYTELWKKFIAICTSGLLAVCRSSYGEVRSYPGTRKMMHELLDEIYQIALLEGINLENGITDKMMKFIDTFPFDSTSSLSRDVMEGKPSEIEYQNGTVVKLAEKHGKDAPINRYIYNCIYLMEDKMNNR